MTDMTLQSADALHEPLRFPLAGKVAIVTGGGTGIGRAAALAYARAGASVVVAGRRAAELQQVVDEIHRQASQIPALPGNQALALPTDVSSEVQVQALVARTREHFGRLDVAFNNAGVLGHFAPITQQSAADFDEVMATNLKGVWLCAKYQIEAFLDQGDGGAIINTSSWLAHGALAGSSIYSASKGALDAMIRALALEYGRQGIRINNICPGIIDTPMARSSGDVAAHQPFVEHTPMKRMGQPEDIGDVAVWLASDGARFITGQSILVDGGYTIGGLRWQ